MTFMEFLEMVENNFEIISVWVAAIVSFSAFLFPLLPEKLRNIIRNWWIKRNDKSNTDIEKIFRMSSEDIQKIYGDFYQDLKQTFTFNFFILLATATATRELTTNSLLVTFSTTSLYICLFNWKIFWNINQRSLAITTIILGLINFIFYILSWSCIKSIWFIPIWVIPMFLAISSVTILGAKSTILKKLQTDKSDKK